MVYQSIKSADVIWFLVVLGRVLVTNITYWQTDDTNLKITQAPWKVQMCQKVTGSFLYRWGQNGWNIYKKQMSMKCRQCGKWTPCTQLLYPRNVSVCGLTWHIGTLIHTNTFKHVSFTLYSDIRCILFQTLFSSQLYNIINSKTM